jgi:nitrate reductase NapAB chaperone NapD
MHYSGLIVACKPSCIEACTRSLKKCPGVDVYVSDEDSGRLVVVLETETVSEQEAGLRRVQALPHVRYAELVYHYFGDAADLAADPGAIAEDPALLADPTDSPNESQSGGW